MNTPNAFAAGFIQEAGDLLSQVEEFVLDVEKNPKDAETLNRLFRVFHTIKGSGAMFGFEEVASFTHHVETVLDKMREGIIQIDSRIVDLILASKDHIKSLIEAASSGAVADRSRGASIVDGLSAFLTFPAVAETKASAEAAAKPAAAEYRISFKPPAGIMASGMDPASLLDELKALGECHISANTGDIPALDRLQADCCHLSWNIRLATDKGINAIRDVFIFVEDESEIKIEAGAAPAAEPVPLPAAPKPAPMQDVPAAGTPVAAAAAMAAVDPIVQKAAKPSASDSFVRVASDRLDRLVNLVGELVINQSRLTQIASKHDLPDLATPVEEIERLIAELRDNVLGIRMMPVGATFNRFRRLVRDLSAELGKEIDLVTEGEETELDKTVLDQLGDPLVHLIRNCIDHGIEQPDVREKTGKSRRGTISLAASHEGSNVLIRIRDDGRGLDVQAIRAKAVEKKLIAADANLSESELFNLVFLPGFSTAKQVTSVSGRGVGMDVVKRQIDAVRGKVSLTSKPGEGATVLLTLPLTLAIIDGLIVELGQDQLIIPMSAVTENVELHRHERARNNQRNVVAVRGELIPYLRLREMFEIDGAEPDIEKVVIVNHEGSRLGLVVDRVLGSHQTVIQSLGRFYRNIEVVSGATIMGDGRVALILDVTGLVHCSGRGPANPGKASQQQ
jgi:two-component system chemotaxis sensor kinase CheA